MNYELLKNRMTNGEPFLKTKAIERINYLADNLYITQIETEELIGLANSNGVDILPDDIILRLDTIEQTTDELTLAVAEMIGGAIE